ncbi:hypothetical protein COU54_04540 [Candidatus Pacearchaeota archaeon CG10_big_fil_rev_8_21_14_0_10_31_24]|nr:MAG: hypothetical protein COU54_04540 [Candidatus Pacearchaeota archaeon CG10_big_fil_rev_8_21_14_0_10_31_24]
MSLPKNFIKTKIKTKNPLISIIIPTYNEEKDIEECIKSIEKQTYKKIETIVVDDGSTDKTLEILKKYKKVIVFKQNHQGPGIARNLGAKKSNGEILVLIDADMVLFPDYVEKLTLPIINNSTLGTIESIQYNIHKTKMQECWGKVVRTAQLEGKNSATVRGIRKKDFLALGGFDKKYGYADDRTFLLKYGIRFDILKDVKCYHKTPPTFKGVFKHSKWIGASLEKGPLKYKIVRAIAPAGLFILFPLIIPILSLKKCRELNKFSLFFPWMLLFITARYFGTIQGLFRRTFLSLNVR